MALVPCLLTARFRDFAWWSRTASTAKAGGFPEAGPEAVAASPNQASYGQPVSGSLANIASDLTITTAESPSELVTTGTGAHRRRKVPLCPRLRRPATFLPRPEVLRPAFPAFAARQISSLPRQTSSPCAGLRSPPREPEPAPLPVAEEPAHATDEEGLNAPDPVLQGVREGERP
ncbi:MAG: hypothetical protein LBR80_15730 [Deltaproteobacteria bacterium]|jgi:hypothetical protein|nr:hypothetical protein [Deltaproteobacteria bacterium]